MFMKHTYILLLAITILFQAALSAQPPKGWQYIRPSNTGVAGDYLYTMNIDSFGIKWTTGFYAFWEEGSVDRFDDSVWTNWSSFEGYIPASRVYNIEFDHLHRVWAGTDTGIAVYDGNKWTQYTYRNTPIPKKDFRVNGIAFDKANNLWLTYNNYYLGGRGGVAKFDGATWTLFTKDNGLLPTWNVSDIVIDRHDNIFISGDVGIINLKSSSYTIIDKTNSQLQNTSISDLYIDNNGILWALSDAALDGFDGKTWIHYNSQNSPLDPYVYCFDVRNNKICVGSTSSRAFIFNGTSWSTYIAPYHVYGTKIDTLGNYWMCGIGFFLKYDGRTTVTYNRYNTGLPEYWMNDIYVDSKNRKWVANGNGGVDVLDEPVWKDYGPYNEGLFPNPVPYTTIGSATTEDKYGNIWMAYWGTFGAVVEIPRGDETDTTDWVIWESANAGVELQFINCIGSDSSGNIWVGLDHDSRVSVLNRATQKWKSFSLTQFGLNGGYTKVQAIQTDAEGNVWAESELGIVVFAPDGNYTTYRIGENGLPFGLLFDLDFDSKGNKWIASDSGLIKFDDVNWTVYNQKNSGMLATHTHAVAVGENDTIYAATFNTFDYPYYGGLSVFDGDRYWETFAEGSSPIPHKQVQDVEIDKLGNIWLDCESEGIALYHKGGVIHQRVSCSAPANAFTSNIKNTSAILNWEFTTGGAQYQVKYKKANSSAVQTIYTTSPRLILSGLQPGTKYQWVVRAKCSYTWSAYSSVNAFTTAALFAGNELKDNEKIAQEKDFIVQPNPATNYLLITFTSTTQAVKEISITDMQGKNLLKKSVTATIGSNNVSLDVSTLSKGTYLLKLQSDNEVRVEKIMKQ